MAWQVGAVCYGLASRLVQFVMAWQISFSSLLWLGKLVSVVCYGMVKIGFCSCYGLSSPVSALCCSLVG